MYLSSRSGQVVRGIDNRQSGGEEDEGAALDEGQAGADQNVQNRGAPAHHHAARDHLGGLHLDKG